MNRDQPPSRKGSRGPIDPRGPIEDCPIDNGPHDDPDRTAPDRGWQRAVPDPVRKRSASRVDGERAWLELIRVFELEQARLLRGACLLRRRDERTALETDPGHGGVSDAELRLALWRRRAEEALALALADGLEPPACLRFCAVHGVDRWPSASELARASVDLEDCAAGRRLVRG